MNRIDALFQKKGKNILSIYFTAGHPSLHDTAHIIEVLEQSGADMIEIGMPFSDPMADGPVIQQSSQTALINGMTLTLLFEQLKNIRQKVNIPLLLMGYLNPVMRFGTDAFCKKCSEVGIDGIILPDLPVHEYEEIWKPKLKEHNLFNIFLVTPQTSTERIYALDALSSGFIYMVSSFSTTGSGKGLEHSLAYFERMKALKLKNPKIIGFGINNKASFENACNYAEGAIIGSAFVKMLENEGVLDDKIEHFMGSILA